MEVVMNELNQQLEIEEKLGELIAGHFGMAELPIFSQITKHVNNALLSTEKRKPLLKDFRAYLEDSDQTKLNFRYRQIIDYYGVETFKSWFELIYGWEFKQEEAS
jgi:hypothetical protein